MRMLEHSFEPEAGVRRVEVITGTGRRRRWSVDERIRPQCLAHQRRQAVHAFPEVDRPQRDQHLRADAGEPQQILGWRREAKRRSGSGASCAPGFAPVVLETPATRAPPAGRTVIEIIVGSVVARVPLGADGATLPGSRRR